MEEPLRLRQVADVEMHVAHGRAGGHPRPGDRAARAHHVGAIERQRVHRQLGAISLPGCSRAVCVDLDSQAVRVAEVERLAHEVIGRTGPDTQAGEVLEEPSQCRPVRQENREVIQPEQSTRGRGAGTLLEFDEGEWSALGTENGHPLVLSQHPEPEHALIIGQRAAQLGHLQPHHANPGLVGEPVPGGSDTELSHRGHAGSPRA